MTIIILLIVLVVAGFIIRALFNQEWRNSAQAKIDAVKQERIFWRLVKGQEGLMLGIEAIFTVHLDSRHLATYLGSLSDVGKRTNDDERVLKLLAKKNIFESIKPLNDAFEKADKTIQETLKTDKAVFTKADIQKIFEDHKEDRILLPDQYDRFVELYLRLLPSREPLEDKHKQTWEELEEKGAIPKGELARVTSGKYTKTDIWETRKKLEEMAGDFEWKTDEIKHDEATVFAVRKSEVEIGGVLGDVLCGKDVKNGALREALTDWEHIQMLRSCAVDLIVPWHGTNLIQRFMWTIVAEIAG
jgi:hypothetical protein